MELAQAKELAEKLAGKENTTYWVVKLCGKRYDITKKKPESSMAEYRGVADMEFS